MVKNTEICSVSVPKLLVEWANMAEISFSEVLQLALWEKKRDWESYNNEKQKILRLKEQIEILLQTHHEYLDESGQADKYKAWYRMKYGDGKNVLD